MKRSIAITRNISLAILIGITIVSCNKDEDEKDVQDNIVGTWKTWAATFVSSVGDTTLTQYLIDSLGLTSEQALLYTNMFNSTLQQSMDGTITFKSDNTYTSTLGGQTDSGTWSLSNDRKKLTMTSTMDNTPVDLEVVRLTEDELEVNLTQNGSQDLNKDNIPESIRVVMNLKMVKQ